MLLRVCCCVAVETSLHDVPAPSGVRWEGLLLLLRLSPLRVRRLHVLMDRRRPSRQLEARQVRTAVRVRALRLAASHRPADRV